MGQDQLLAAGPLKVRVLTGCLLALALGADARGQGPLHRENWAYSHLQWRREQLQVQVMQATPAQQVAVRDLLDEPDQGLPFRNVVRASAQLSGRGFDDTLLFRSMVGAFVLPEVVDPDSSREECRSLSVSVFLPARVQPAGAASFRVLVRDTSGRVVHESEAPQECSVDDLRLAQCLVPVPCAGLEDGEYTVEVATFVAGKEAVDADPRLVQRFAVLRGYQQRAEQVVAAATRLGGAASGIPACSLLAVAAEVNRAYSGEAPNGAATGREDLLLLERMVARSAKGEDSLEGEAGDVLLGLPTGAQRPLTAVLRMPSGGKASCLVVVAAGSPFYGVDSPRPGAPACTSPRWTARACADTRPVGAAVLFVESPGATPRWSEALARGVGALQDRLGIAPAHTTLVVERDAAVAVCFGLAELLPRIETLDLVNGGVLSRKALEGLQGRRVVAHVSRGPLSRGLQHTKDVVAGSQGPLQFDGSFLPVSADGYPWQFALPLALRAVTGRVALEAPR